MAGAPRRLPRDDPPALVRPDLDRRPQRRRCRFRVGVLRLHHRRVPRHPHRDLRDRDPAAWSVGPRRRGPEDRAVRPSCRVRACPRDRRLAPVHGVGGSVERPRFVRRGGGARGRVPPGAHSARAGWPNRLVYGKRATPYEVLAEFSERVGETYADRRRAPSDGTAARRGDRARTARRSGSASATSCEREAILARRGSGDPGRRRGATPTGAVEVRPPRRAARRALGRDAGRPTR